MRRIVVVFILFIIAILTFADDYKILYSTRINLDSDESLEHIILKGEKVSDIYWGNFEIILEDDGKVFDTLTGMGGYEPKLSYFDFDGNGIEDILLISRSGGSGNYINYLLYLYDGNELKLYTMDDFMSKLKGYFMDQYRVVIGYDEYYTYIDLSDRKTLYQELKAYDEYGRFIKDYNSLMIGGISELEPYDFGNDGVYDLKGSISISGIYHADRIGYIHFIYSVKENRLRWLEISKVIYVK